LKSAEGRRELKCLTMLHARETRVITSLATKLRLTPQSRYSKPVAFTRARPTPRPWDEFE
jgi:hypothetical protein